jgi:hypothetical protein
MFFRPWPSYNVSETAPAGAAVLTDVGLAAADVWPLDDAPGAPQAESRTAAATAPPTAALLATRALFWRESIDPPASAKGAMASRPLVTATIRPWDQANGIAFISISFRPPRGSVKYPPTRMQITIAYRGRASIHVD